MCPKHTQTQSYRQDPGAQFDSFLSDLSLSVSLPLNPSVCPASALCCRVFPAPGLPTSGSWWSDVECGEEGGGSPA